MANSGKIIGLSFTTLIIIIVLISSSLSSDDTTSFQCTHPNGAEASVCYADDLEFERDDLFIYDIQVANLNGTRIEYKNTYLDEWELHFQLISTDFIGDSPNTERHKSMFNIIYKHSTTQMTDNGLSNHLLSSMNKFYSYDSLLPATYYMKNDEVLNSLDRNLGDEEASGSGLYNEDVQYSRSISHNDTTYVVSGIFNFMFPENYGFNDESFFPYYTFFTNFTLTRHYPTGLLIEDKNEVVLGKWEGSTFNKYFVNFDISIIPTPSYNRLTHVEAEFSLPITVYPVILSGILILYIRKLKNNFMI